MEELYAQDEEIVHLARVALTGGRDAVRDQGATVFAPHEAAQCAPQSPPQSPRPRRDAAVPERGEGARRQPASLQEALRSREVI